MPDTPEQKARVAIDAKLDASGWLVQDREDMDLTAGRGIAVREFPMKPGFGFADYLLYLDRKALGAIEAMADGILTGVEAQSAKYATGLPANFPAHQRPLPYLTDTDSLPAPPDILANEIADELETAFDLFSKIAKKLPKSIT